MELEQQAIDFATRAHEGQVRKYTGEPYITHPIAVAEIVKTVTDDKEMIAAAILHDVIEDCDVCLDDIMENFSVVVSALVYQLTDVSSPGDGNRAIRKAMDRDWLSCACDKAKTIKLADLIHNSSCIMAADKNFAKVYMKEKRDLLDVLHGGDSTLHARATMMVEKYILSN
jgi:(p)ppGpp synthase/HD superfamily hydrolase